MNPFNVIKYWPIKDCEWGLLSRDVWIAKIQSPDFVLCSNLLGYKSRALLRFNVNNDVVTCIFCDSFGRSICITMSKVKLTKDS